jgi:hypothetical protein
MSKPKLVTASPVKHPKPYQVAPNKVPTDVAQFCVDQLTSNEHVGSAVTIANS